MLIPSKFSGYQSGIRLYPGGKGGDAPSPDPLIGQAAMKSAQTGDDMVAFLKQSWAENQPRLDAQDALNQKVIDQNMRLAQNAEDRANDAYSFYKDNGRPVIQQTLKDAQDWDSQANIDKARGQVANDTQAQFDQQTAANTRMLTRMGVNPNSGKFAALNQQMLATKALGTAGAMNQAGEQRQLQGINLRQQAGNLASGMPAQSMGFSGQASGMGSAASGVGASGLAGRLQAQGQMTSGMGAASNAYGTAGSTMNSQYGNQVSAYGSQQQAQSSAMSGIGALAGTAMMMMMADGGNVGSGGRVRGPGTGISDEVPAVNRDTGQRIQLSNGEYVIPADVVKKVGEDKFDKLIEKYHVPAARQRQGNLARSH